MIARLIPLIALLAWTPTAAAQDAAAVKPVLLELYTSQGCAACPRANAIFAELGARDDVVALSFSVDYWDYLGWSDTFARDEFVERQRSYAAHLSARGVYTPQLVIDGVTHVNGAKQDRVERAIRRRVDDNRPGPTITVSWQGAHLQIAVGGAPETHSASNPADIYLVAFEPGAVQVDVASGENAGRRVAVYNAVTSLARVGEWTGAPTTIEVETERRPHVAFVQEAGMGAVLAAYLDAPA